MKTLFKLFFIAILSSTHAQAETNISTIISSLFDTTDVEIQDSESPIIPFDLCEDATDPID